ncbi:MAG TPA: type II toxin-antitoxin system RelE/ParE family toxin [Dehalococcoidia bacterium]|nr:type II toxin-antitoxin system RelE/ParE family toxin [Dehalococcoidia bacterium]
MAEVDWAVDARNDLADIQEFIALDSPNIAAAFVERLLAVADRIREFPRSGRVVPEFEDERTREVLVGDYRIVYRLIRQNATIVAVSHAKRDLRRIAEQRGWSV